MSEKSLKLKAKDAEDVQVISAILQDAIAPVCDMAYQPDEKAFVMVVHRFCRDCDTHDCYERVCCAVHVRGVEGAQLQGIELEDGERMLDLLAAILEGKALTFVFAGAAKIRLTLGDWSLILEDFGERWPTQNQPIHLENRPERL